MSLSASIQDNESNNLQFTIETYSTSIVSSVNFAISELKQAVKEFTALEQEIGDFSTLYSRMISKTHNLTAAIRKCQIARMQREEILRFMSGPRNIYRRSPFVARVQDWERGYPGDFETIEYICDGVNRVSDSDLLGYCIEDYSLNCRIAQQHRNKVQLQANHIYKTCLEKENAQILSIGCGGARDLRLIADLLEKTSATFVLCDSDPDALECARTNLGEIADRCTFVQGKVPRVLNKLKFQSNFDLVVAGGLFDYLPGRWIELVLREVWQNMLNPAGKIFFTNIALGNPYSTLIEYFCDWILIERDEDDIKNLCQAIGVKEFLTTYRDTTNLTIISEITKPGFGQNN
jgi:SAM-dependent methyltransferase